MIDDIGADLMNGVQNQISGCQLHVCYENIDFRILVNIILKNHQNSNDHWIAQYITFDRVPSDGLDDRKSLVPVTPENLTTLTTYWEKMTWMPFRQNFIVLVARVLLEFFEFMKP